MSLENRPYVGTWRLDGQGLVQYTPDALVYINGDTSVPGCPKCNGRIDIQKFITEVSVDAGVDPGAASASFTMSIPLHHTDSFARDAKFILTPGLEVHIYMRGYFPVKGMFRNLGEGRLDGEIQQPSEETSAGSVRTDTQGNSVDTAPILNPGRDDVLTQAQVRQWGRQNGVSEDIMVAAIALHSEAGNQGEAEREVIVHTFLNNGLVRRYEGVLWNYAVGKNNKTGPQTGAHKVSTARLPSTPRELKKSIDTVKATLAKRLESGTSSQGVTNYMHPKSYLPGSTPEAILAEADRVTDNWVGGGSQPLVHEGQDWSKFRSFRLGSERRIPKPSAVQAQAEKILTPATQETHTADPGFVLNAADKVGEGLIPVADSLLDQYGLGGRGIENLLSYPYYHVFHGVVSQVSHAWSGGVNTVSINCVSMLHFWQYHTMSTNASIFGARPSNSKLKTSLVGHNFTGMHPYQIMYTLHNDMVGAAGGVGWALSSKTNQTAVGEVAGESLFSLNIRYWEQRFSQRMVKLRMHGASGELFSAVQSSFLGRNSSDSITQLVRHRFSDPSSRKGRAKGIMEDAISTGLFNKRKLEALLFARSTTGNAKSNAKSKGGTSFELNLAEMQAFASNIANLGQVATFESVYESKLDIAQKVMEITGFEFYQDVDGDFVFKPPMYNLDTSSSRVYRIEDIDLISITTDEKEPQATYCTVKGSHFKNVVISGLENEWGVKGQYIDYRLVAQFGWRPFQYETAYFNDPKSMFFSAINRLDILNAPSNAASVSIPKRAEMRPGYPVYIEYLDCFYYCNGFSHSFSVGGQCTTNLQLIAKRAKFYAPGRPDAEGIQAIDLSNTILPARPLEVADHTGHPRLAGFPNVVMALDPHAINPLFWVVGADIERLDDPVVLRNILKMGSQEGVGVIASKGDGFYTLTVPATESESGEQKAVTVEYFLSDDTRLPEQIKRSRTKRKTGAKEIPKTTVDIVKAGRAYTKRSKAAADKIQAGQRSLPSLWKQYHTLGTLIRRAPDEKTKDKLRKRQTALKKRIDDTVKQVEGTKKQIEEDLGKDIGDGVAQLNLLIKTIGERYFLQGGQDLRRIPETHNLLDMLSDKKASLSNGNQPGQYRYYSASHPAPDQQGQDLVEYSNPPDGKSAEIKRKNSFLDPEWQGSVVQGFLETPTATIPGTVKPEAELGDIRPSRGMRVLTSNPSFPNGEIVPTSEIREMMFSVQSMTQTKGVTDNAPDDAALSLGKGALWRFRQRMSTKSVGIEASGEVSINDYFSKAWGVLLNDLTGAVVATNRKARELDESKTLPLPLSLPAFPATLPTSKKKKVDCAVKLKNYRLEDTAFFGPQTAKGVPSWTTDQQALGGKWPKKSTAEFLDGMGALLASEMDKGLGKMRADWLRKIKEEAGYTDVQIQQISSEYNVALAARWRVEVKRLGVTRTKKEGSIARKVTSPVFPVSDAKGYEVIGSYRYGRGVDIEPGGVWDSLHAQDPLQFLDRKTVEDILDAVIAGKTITVVREHTVNGGKKVTVATPLQGKKAVVDVEKRVTRQLRQHLTDRQIIDLGLAIPNAKDPSMLQLNLMNWFSEGNKEGIHKLPVNNAAFTLADLTDQQEGRVCACKAAEAGILLEAFVSSEFLKFSAPGAALPRGYGTGGEDRATEFLTKQAMMKSVAWKQRQDALRGAVMERASGNILKTFQDLKTSAIQGIQGKSVEQQRALANFSNAKKSLNQAAAAAFNEDEDT